MRPSAPVDNSTGSTIGVSSPGTLESNLAAAKRVVLDQNVPNKKLSLGEFIRVASWIGRLLIVFPALRRCGRRLRAIVAL